MSRFGDGVAECLLNVADTANEEAQSKTQEHRSKYGAKYGSLDDVEVVFRQ